MPENDSNSRFSDVVEYVLNAATADELDRLTEAAKQRRENLRMMVAASLNVGDKVMIVDIRPAYLKGLTGTIARFETIRRSNTAVLKLDTASAERLKFSNGTYYDINTVDYELSGILLGCLRPI